MPNACCQLPVYHFYQGISNNKRAETGILLKSYSFEKNVSFKLNFLTSNVWVRGIPEDF